ncbi:hypothetical protein OCOL_001680 [Ordospora colligata]|uniref:Zn-finger domain-containing protein n=1 Tax=Ordospora colligata OC4 TaxID=1354746 RepID=A0A0B2UIE1_9MICR|nr:Zn-finger domain-containing protein [Ordospora colligata OC4]KHN69128.1 Zn-finger domain-containing protein [Ordospora colligata OC4]
MKPCMKLDFRSWIQKTISEADTGTDKQVDKVAIYGTEANVCVFHLDGQVFFDLSDIPFILSCFGIGNESNNVQEYLRKNGFVTRIKRFDSALSHSGFELVESSLLDNGFAEKLSSYCTQKMFQKEETISNQYTAHDLGSEPMFSRDCYDSKSPVDDQAFSSGVNKLYPFDYQWTDSVMDNIIKNIYTTEGHKNVANAFEDVQQNQSCRSRQSRSVGCMKDRPFVCSFNNCKRAFKRYEHLKRHILMHTGERPHKCRFPGCSKSFSRSDNLSQHYKIHNISNEMHTRSYEPYRYLNKKLN